MSLTGRTFRFKDTLTLPEEGSGIEYTMDKLAVFFQKASGSDPCVYTQFAGIYVTDEQVMFDDENIHPIIVYDSFHGGWQSTDGVRRAPTEIIFTGEPSNFDPDESTFMTWFEANTEEVIVSNTIYLVSESDLTSVANAIRAKTGSQSNITFPAEFVSNIGGLANVTSVTATAGDVLSGKSFVNSSCQVVNGSLVIQHYYTGTTDPSSSTGVDGDIYLKT